MVYTRLDCTSGGFHWEGGGQVQYIVDCPPPLMGKTATNTGWYIGL
jgi:hypothetical protein